MKTVNTDFNQELLEDYYPAVFKQQTAHEIYKNNGWVNLPENHLFIVMGTDSGKLIDYLLEIAQPGQKFIFLDKAEVISFLGSKVSNSKYSSLMKTQALVDIDTFDFSSLYGCYDDYIYRNAITLLNSVMSAIQSHPYENYTENMNSELAKFSMDRAENRRFDWYFDAQLEDVNDLVFPIKKLQNKLGHKVSGIVLGGGPSLDEVIPWLKKNQNNIWIFAVSRICARLKDEGITPDFIGVIDPQPLMFDYSQAMFHFADQSVLLTGEHPCPEIIKQWSGLKAYTKFRFPWLRDRETNFDAGGPTVTNHLFSCAAFLGVREIYLSGVDMCYTPDGVTHEASSIETRKQDRKKGEVEVVNYAGQQTTTNLQLYQARNSLETQVGHFQSMWPELKVMNLSRSAAVVKNIDYLSLQKIEVSSQKNNVISEFKADLENSRAHIMQYLDKTRVELKRYQNWLQAIQKLAKQGLQLAPKIFLKPSLIKKRSTEVIKIKNKIEDKLGDDISTLVHYVNDDFMNTLKPLETEAQMSEQEMVRTFTDFFHGVDLGSGKFLDKLSQALEENTRRKLELKENVPFTELADNWLHSRLPGRFNVWLENFSLNNIEYYQDKYPEEVEKLQNAFDARLNETQQLHAKFEQPSLDPSQLINDLQLAFRSKNLDEILNLKQKLAAQQGNPEMTLYFHYASGLQLELNGELQNALSFYKSLDPNFEMYLIQDRVYQLSIQLEDYETALASIQLLAKMEQRYIPVFANLIAFLGNEETAIKILQQYPELETNTFAMADLIRLLWKNDKVLAQEYIALAKSLDTIDQNELSKLLASLDN